MSCTFPHGLLGYSPTNRGEIAHEKTARDLHRHGLRATAQGERLLPDALCSVLQGQRAFRAHTGSAPFEARRVPRSGVFGTGEGQRPVQDALPEALASWLHSLQRSEEAPKTVFSGGVRKPSVREGAMPRPLCSSAKAEGPWGGRPPVPSHVAGAKWAVRPVREPRAVGERTVRKGSRHGVGPLSRDWTSSAAALQQLQPRAGSVRRRPGTPFQGSPLRATAQGSGLEG